MTLISGAIVSMALAAGPAVPQEKEVAKANEQALIAADLEAKFAKAMTGATLVGRFTIDGMKDGNIPRPERYELGEVKKLKGDMWLLEARIKYGKFDFKAPLKLRIKWAGDTPVINMDDFTIIGMGTFSFRVLFDGDRYVGTWQHGKVGGHMFGKIEPKKPGAESAEKSGTEAPERKKKSKKDA